MMAERVGAILVPLDGSAFAEGALKRAVQLAEATGARIDVVQVRTLLGGAEGEAEKAGAAHTIEQATENYLRLTADRVAAQVGRPVQHALLRDRRAEREYGGPSRVGIARLLGAYARRHAIDLIVLTTHGRGGFSRAWLGSVADALIRRSPVPLLLERAAEPGGGSTAAFRRVLIPLDGSAESELAIPAAQAIASTAATINLLRAVPPTYGDGKPYVPGRLQSEGPAVSVLEGAALTELEEVASRLGDGLARIRLATPVAHDPARAILDTADAEGIDLIAITTRGRRGLTRSALGSVADKVVRGAKCSVLVCSPGHRRSAIAANADQASVRGS